MDQVWQSLTLLAVFSTLILITSAAQTATGRDYGRWGNPYAWYVPLWILQAVILLIPFYTFGYPTSWLTIGYIAVCHAAFAAGTVTCMVFGSRGPGGRVEIFDDRPPRLLMMLMVVGCVAQLLCSLDSLAASGTALADRFDSNGLAAARAEGAGVTQTAFLGPTLGVVIPMAMLIEVCLPIYAYAIGIRARWSIMPVPRLLFFCGFALVLFDSLVVRAGRFPVLLLAVAFANAWSLGRLTLRGRIRRSPSVAQLVFGPLKVALLSSVIGLMLLGAASMQEMRANGLEPNEQMQTTFDVRLTPGARDLAGNGPFGSFFFLQLLYFAHSFNVLSVYVDTPKSQMPPIALGQYNFGQIYRVVGRINPSYDPEFWEKTRASMFRVIEDHGRLGNTWGTQLRDFATDFGYTGTIFIVFLVGMIGQYLTDFFYKNRSYLSATTLALYRVFLLFSAFHSLLFVGFIGSPIMMTVPVVFLTAIRTRRGIVAPQS